MIVNLIKLRRNYVTIDSDKILIDLLESQNLSKDYKHYVMLSLMCSLLPYKSRHVFGSKQWKPKIADCKEGIVLKVELAGDVETAVATKIEKLQSVEVPVQPFIIVVGSGASIQQIYVYIFGELYSAATVLKGIDIVFKTYHVFHLKYQFQSEHIWAFIQSAIQNGITKFQILSTL
ncbi:uncharacterized protein LOC116183039 [Photinus pyralis]|uniref:uncharacterized protein LOC116166343 n=1 Tax=Photinus pyralis TaxID=7054 RepID=UPI0012674006|nr:uncharacterized protein LOC116166343 [Photinus pyralis]XP_031359499.1 uncharacterized protein LOC116183039 [Photinus pyralis]